MTLTPLASLSDVQNAAGQPFTAQQQTYITNLLVIASSMVRSYCRNAFTAVTADVITVNGNWGTRLTLPQRPVTAIESVVIRGQAMTVGSYAWDRLGHIDLVSAAASWQDYDNIFGPPASLASGGSTLYTGATPDLSGPAGSIWPDVQSGPNWGGPSTQIVVTYDHGYTTIPGEIVNEVAGLVAAQIAVPVGILNEKIGGYAVTYIRSSGGAMTLPDATKQVLDRYRIRTQTVSAANPR